MTENPANILIIEDEEVQRETLREYLRLLGHKVIATGKGAEGIKLAEQEKIDIVISDYCLPDIDGAEITRQISKMDKEISIIVVTAYSSIDSAVEVIKAGAFHYLTKPVDFNQLETIVDKARRLQLLTEENRTLRDQLADKYGLDKLVYASEAMEEVVSKVRRVAENKVTVLITGESGVGKEMIARALHYASPRWNKPFIAVNAAALNENLIESTLFGHERGAFTGAVNARQGKFEIAHKGTLFIDEVGDLPANCQAKLLRTLQENEIERVGSNKVIKVDVRIITSTNRSLEEEIKQGRFREDLFYRLNVVNIHLPPLRERKEDILPLAEHFLSIYAAKHNKRIKHIAPETLNLLLKYPFSGNVRELENMIEQAVVLCEAEVLSIKDLPADLQSQAGEERDERSKTLLLPAFFNRQLKRLIAKGQGINVIKKEFTRELERQLLQIYLDQTKGHITKAAKLAGIPRQSFYRLLKQLGLKEQKENN